MTQSNFFRLSLFHYEDNLHKQKPKDNILAPWASNEQLPTQAFKANKTSVLDQTQQCIVQVQKKDSIKLPSNLLPNNKPSSKKIYFMPKLPKVQPINKNLKLQIKSKGMPIQEFLSQKREEKELQQKLHRKSIAKINESIENSFLAKRNLRKKNIYSYSKTIDLKRELYSPLQIYRSQQVVEISPQKSTNHQKQFKVMDKYLPIKSDRYQL